LFYPEFVVVDEADEFARAITEGITVREEERMFMVENSSNSPEIQHLLKKMNRDEILAMNENPEMIRKCLISFYGAVEHLIREISEKINEIEEELQKNLQKSEKDMLKAKLVKLRRQLDYFERKINKIVFFANNMDKIFVYTKTDSKNLYFEMFCSEEELITRLFKHAKKLCVVTATPFEVSKFVKVSYEVPFKARVIYAPVGKMTFKEVFQEGNTDLLKKAVIDYVIPIHHYVSMLLNSKVKTPIHCGSLRRHGTFVADILKNNGQSVILHEEGKLDETIRKFKEGDYDFLCVVAAEYGGDWYWCPLQFILKVPYANPYDPRELAIKRRFGEEIWRKRYEWDALSRLIQACGRNARRPDQFSVSIILDKKFEELYAKYENLIPQWFKNRLIWLGDANGAGADGRSKETKQEAEKAFKEWISKLWGSLEAFYRMQEFNKKRVELLNELYLVYPDIQLQYADISESFRSALVGYDWGLCFAAPIVHYRILPNEIVFDVDSEDKTKAKEAAKKIIVMLKSFGAEPLAGFSGNRGYHIHVLLAPPKGEIEDFVKAAGIKEFRNCTFDWLLDLAGARGIDTSLIDSGIMHASEHTIRSFYSFNPKGKNGRL
jgi:hypothetical protein